MTVHTGSTGPPIRANTMEPEVFRQIIAGLSPAPGVIGVGDLAVAQHSTPNMSVDIAAGFAVIAGTTTVPVQGSYWFYNDATATLAIAAAHATLDRIDIVCAQIQDAFYAGASNTPQLVVVTGTPAGSPVAPSPPASSIILAQVYVTHAESSVLNAAITDKRVRAGGLTSYRAMYYRAAALSLVASTFTVIALDTSVFDPNSNYSAGTYTCPVNGIYRVTTAQEYPTNAAVQRIIADVAKNVTSGYGGTSGYRLSERTAVAGAGNYETLAGSVLIPCVAGDHLTLWSFCDHAVAIQVGNAPLTCYGIFELAYPTT